MSALLAIDGTRVSPFCFGTMQFGGTAGKDISAAMYEQCRAAGINFFDTAHVYTNGTSERFLGEFIRREREQIILATKVAYQGGSSAENIRRQFEESRSRLDLDVVDILYLHRWDPDTAIEDTIACLAMLQETGAIRYIGVSNFAAWQVMKAQAAAAKVGTRIDIVQPMYSLVKRQAEVELFPMALEEGIAVASYSPLGAGLLTGKYQRGGTGRLSTDERYAHRYGQDWMQKTAGDFFELAFELEIEPATLAIAWAANHPAVTSPIISARDVRQLQPSLDALTFDLEPKLYARIEGLSRRPAPATDRLEEA